MVGLVFRARALELGPPGAHRGDERGAGGAAHGIDLMAEKGGAIYGAALGIAPVGYLRGWAGGRPRPAGAGEQGEDRGGGEGDGADGQASPAKRRESVSSDASWVRSRWSGVTVT